MGCGTRNLTSTVLLLLERKSLDLQELEHVLVSSLLLLIDELQMQQVRVFVIEPPCGFMSYWFVLYRVLEQIF
ncbi:hypothetical protein D3C81_1742710 [compost metagenome]